MPRGQPPFSTIRDPSAQHVWDKFAFPVHDPDLSGMCEKWIAAKATLAKPYCFTPSREFWFGGKRYIPLYPCVAFATKNFGFVVQRRWDGLTYGRE